MTDADVTAEAGPAERETEGRDEGTLVTAHTSEPGRTVLTERGNTEAWIASSLTLDGWP